jgi:hypothetical protein
MASAWRAITVAALALAACATEEKYKAALDAWLDKPEAALVAAWGPPVAVATSSTGERILSYRTSGGVPLAANDRSLTGSGAMTLTQSPGGGTSSSYTPLNCQTDFTIIGGTVLSWRISGNKCNAL